jgi:hypothetical protein
MGSGSGGPRCYCHLFMILPNERREGREKGEKKEGKINK